MLNIRIPHIFSADGTIVWITRMMFTALALVLACAQGAHAAAAPILASIESSPLIYPEGSPALAITATLTVADNDSANLGSATVLLSAYQSSQDSLTYVKVGKITGTFDPTSGIMQLNGSDTVANYQAALRAVKYRNSKQFPSLNPRYAVISAYDGENNASNQLVREIDLKPADQPAVLSGIETTPLIYTEGSPAIIVTTSLVVSDPDSLMLASAAVSISGVQPAEDILTFMPVGQITGTYQASNGRLQLHGSDTVANYQAALRSVAYRNSRSFPTPTPRQVAFQIGASHNSNIQSREIDIVLTHQPPTLANIETVALNYTEGAPAVPLTTTLTVSDPDSASLVSAEVVIWAYQLGEDVLSYTKVGNISGVFDSSSGTMRLSGSDTLANYQAALRAIRFRTIKSDPSLSPRQVIFTANDGHYQSSSVARGVTITPLHRPAVLANLETTALTFTEGGASLKVTGTLTISDPDSPTMNSGAVSIGNFLPGEDVLSYTKVGNVNGSFDASTGVMTLSGIDSVANYQSAMRAVSYRDVRQFPSLTQRSLTFQATDVHYASNAVSRPLVVKPLMQPVLSNIETSTLVYTRGTPASAITASLVVSEPGTTNLASASVSISNYQNGADILTYNRVGNIIGTFDAGAGIMMLVGTDTVARYQAALRAVKYQDTRMIEGTTTHVAVFKVYDGHYWSNAQARNITVAPPLFAVNINFQPANTAVLSGTLADNSQPFADRANGYQYGWNAPFDETRQRLSTASPDARYDTLNHMQKPSNPNASWQIAVPNGTYQVRVVCGDPVNIDSVFKINVEGILVLDGVPMATPVSAHWIDSGFKTVVVTDGFLTVTNASGARNNKINFIEIMQIPVGVARRGSGTDDPVLAIGFFQP